MIGDDMRLLLFAIIISSIAACSEVIYKPVPLDRPTRPALPRIEEHGLQCLSPQVYETLTERQRLRREYTEQLEIIIDSTKQKQG